MRRLLVAMLAAVTLAVLATLAGVWDPASSSAAPAPAAPAARPATPAPPAPAARPPLLPIDDTGTRPAASPPTSGRVASGCATVPSDMVCVNAASFRMGSLVGDADERPLRQVTVGAFLMDKHEVSFGAYLQCVQAGRCNMPRYYPPEPEPGAATKRGPTIQRMPRARAAAKESGSGTVQAPPQPAKTQVKVGNLMVDADLPVAGITWDDAREYCAFVQKHLPTEAQWELAARGETSRYYPWGSDAPDCRRANTDKCGKSPMPVDSLPAGASPFGLLHMTGNVWEWVNDWYDARYYASAPSASDPIGPVNSQDPISGIWAYRYRVLRGGSWSGIPAELHASYRYRLLPSMYANDIGFRCARSGLSLEPTAPSKAPLPAVEPTAPVPGEAATSD